MENGCEAVLSPSLILLVLWSPSLILLVRASAISCVNTAEAVRSVSLALLPESTGIRHFNGNTFNLFDADGNEKSLVHANSRKVLFTQTLLSSCAAAVANPRGTT